MAMIRREVLTIITSLISSGIFANNKKPNKTERHLNNNKLPDGVLSAVLTPLDGNLNTDYPRLVKHIKWLLSRETMASAY
jgi:hypothetical protein